LPVAAKDIMMILCALLAGEAITETATAPTATTKRNKSIWIVILQNALRKALPTKILILQNRKVEVKKATKILILRAAMVKEKLNFTTASLPKGGRKKALFSNNYLNKASICSANL
jgi:hypothetical protein